MTVDDLTKKVILLLGLTEYHYELILTFVEDGIDYMRSAGVCDEIIYSKKSIGILTQYVTDVWNYNSGKGKLSPFLHERITQLALECDGNNV